MQQNNRSNRRLMSIAAVAVALGFSASVNAAGGVFIGADAGLADPKSSSSTEEFAWRVGAGFDFNENFGVSANAWNLGDYSNQHGGESSSPYTDPVSGDPVGSPGTDSVKDDMDLHAYGIVMHTGLKVTDSLSAGVDFGGAHVVVDRSGSINGSEEGVAPVAGMKLTYSVSDNLAVQGGVTRFFNVGGDDVGGEFDVDYYSAGVKYNF